MSKNPINRETFRRYVHLLGNPYAKSQLVGAEELEPAIALEAVDPDGGLREPTPGERAYARRQGNQYTLLSVAIQDSAGTSNVPKPHARVGADHAAHSGISKKDFGDGCRRIFRHYIPAVEQGRLRRHHRDFITRNQNRAPAERQLLLEELTKYDLGSLAGVQARFNRERADISEQKLKQIEESILGKKK